jgi:glycosyltransferase involved in cell wall biosynthesis
VEQGDKIYDVTIMPSMRVDHVLAAHDLEKRDRGRKLGLIVAIFADTVGNYDQDGQLSFPRSSLFLRLAMRFCNCAPKRPRVIFATESEGLIEQYATFCGLRLKYLPHVTSVPETLMARDQRPEGKLVMGTFGFTRYDKGTDVFHDALTAREPESFKGLEFVVQWTGDYSLPDGRRAERRPELSDRFDLRYIDAFSRSEDYYEWLSKIDLIFLPYRENFYKAKLSRVAIDAAMVGLPIIYPKGTWLEEFANRFASGVGFEPDNPISLGEAIVNARESFDSLSRDAVRKAAEVRVHFSGQSFFKCIENFGSR